MLSPFTDVYGEAGPRADLIARAMTIIDEEGSGVIVILNRPIADFQSRAVQGRVNPDLSMMDELRDYGVGAQILTELGVHDMVLLTNSHHTLVALDGYGLSVVGERPILPAAQ